MIIKSLSRKAKGSHAVSGAKRWGGGTPFATLVRYMNRGIEEEEGKAVLWHNLYGSERMSEAEIVAAFEENAVHLRERKNGNALYHEILSFSAGHTVRGDELHRMVADVGQEYLRERAPDQLGYGVIHADTDHVHLHLMLSANAVGRPERVRLTKEQFAQAQKKTERYVLDRYQELAQTPVYGRERPREKIKSDAREQAMKARTGEPSHKEQIKARMHRMFQEAASFDELAALAKAEGFSFYQRGKIVGVSVAGPDGAERKHRLSTLGVQEHYEATNARLSAPREAKAAERQEPTEKPVREPEPRPVAKHGALEAEIRELLDGAEAPETEATRRERELRDTLEKSRGRDRAEDGGDRGER